MESAYTVAYNAWQAEEASFRTAQSAHESSLPYWPGVQKPAVAVANHSVGVLVTVPSAASATVAVLLLDSCTVIVPGSVPEIAATPAVMLPPRKVALWMNVTNTPSEA